MKEGQQTEHEIRSELLKVPDHVALKYACEYANKLQESNDNNVQLINHYRKLYQDKLKEVDVIMEVIERFFSGGGSKPIKKEIALQLAKERMEEDSSKEVTVLHAITCTDCNKSIHLTPQALNFFMNHRKHNLKYIQPK